MLLFGGFLCTTRYSVRLSGFIHRISHPIFLTFPVEESRNSYIPSGVISVSSVRLHPDIFQERPHGVRVQHLSSQRIHKSGSLFLKTKSASCALPEAPPDSPCKYKRQQQLNKSARCVSSFSNVDRDAFHRTYLPQIYRCILSFFDWI